MSNVFSASISRITVATMMNGQTSGRVMAEHLPRRRAVQDRRLHGSCGSDAMPPSTISMTSGVHCHVYTMTKVGITVELS